MQLELRDARLRRVDKALARVAAQVPPPGDAEAKADRDATIAKIEGTRSRLVAERYALRELRNAEEAVHAAEHRRRLALAGTQESVVRAATPEERQARIAQMEARLPELDATVAEARATADAARAAHDRAAAVVRQEGAFTAHDFDGVVQCCEAAASEHAATQPRAVSYPPPTPASERAADVAVAILDAMEPQPDDGAAVGVLDYGPGAHPRYTAAVSGDDDLDTRALVAALRAKLASALGIPREDVQVLDPGAARSPVIQAVMHPRAAGAGPLWRSTNGSCVEAKLYRDRQARRAPQPAGMTVAWYGGRRSTQNNYPRSDDISRMYPCPCCEYNSASDVSGSAWEPR
jgi:hypothetical protein